MIRKSTRVRVGRERRLVTDFVGLVHCKQNNFKFLIFLIMMR